MPEFWNSGPSWRDLENGVLGGERSPLSFGVAVLEKLMNRTKNSEVAGIILEVGEEKLFNFLMTTYNQHGHHGDKWLENHRKEGMRDLIYRMKVLAKHPDARLDHRIRKKVAKLLALVKGG